LSIVDMIDAGTLELDLAAYLMARIARGASFMVGAKPGGAGKTTVMCALLNLIPADTELVAATPAAVRAAASGSRRCYVCHEIGAGPYFAYLWGGDLRAYCTLPAKGHMLATNLHADDLDEAQAQVCLDNGVPSAHFNRFELLVFLRVDRGVTGTHRVVEKVYALNPAGSHDIAFDARDGRGRLRLSGPSAGWTLQCRAFLKSLLPAGIRTIEEVRSAVVEFLTAYSRP